MKIKLTKRAVEARIKRALLEDNKKLKKKGDQYLTIDLISKKVDEKVYGSFIELVNAFDIMDEWEELEADESKPAADFQSIDELVKLSMSTALDFIEKGFKSAISYDANWGLTETFDYQNFTKNEELLKKLVDTFFEFYPKPNLSDTEHAHNPDLDYKID